MNDSLVLAPNGPQPGGRWIPGRLSRIALLAALIISSAPAFPAEDPSEACRELRPKAVEALRRVLDQEQRWIKVHAAEFLLALDYPQGVKEAFLNERTAHESEPKYRIGIWRVLARTSFDEKHSAQWSDKIRRVFLDPSAPDRLHALESLAKLGCKVREEEAHLVEEAAKMENSPMAPYAAWMLLNSGRKQGESRLAELLGSRDAKMRGTAAYALRHLRTVSPSLGDRLLELAQAEPIGSEARIDLVCAAAVHAPAERRPGLVKSLVRYAREGSPAERFQACDTLASLATGAELPMLAGFLSDPNGDVRSSAAWAVLRVGRRLKHGLGFFDWSVILVYAVGILAIGWYYWRRTKTTEDYLLGGRKMRPLAVGLSFFAALFSTISYLAWPGELIKYGPMILSIVVAYPLVAIVVGRFMIPYIMKLRITSAYEILETRLGLSVRMLGSALFLLLRLLWMAVIIYATVSKVLVPLLALDPSAIPYLSIVMGVVPLVYTAMGGLRAGVVVDVLKSAIPGQPAPASRRPADLRQCRSVVHALYHRRASPGGQRPGGRRPAGCRDVELVGRHQLFLFRGDRRLHRPFPPPGSSERKPPRRAGQVHLRSHRSARGRAQHSSGGRPRQSPGDCLQGGESAGRAVVRPVLYGDVRSLGNVPWNAGRSRLRHRRRGGRQLLGRDHRHQGNQLPLGNASEPCRADRPWRAGQPSADRTPRRPSNKLRVIWGLRSEAGDLRIAGPAQPDDR